MCGWVGGGVRGQKPKPLGQDLLMYFSEKDDMKGDKDSTDQEWKQQHSPDGAVTGCVVKILIIL